ncbi:hypothetical protein CBD41_09290 [bacterium TMED181]|nr:MAG: hypothetical protein CBD41_09290 [bacterium TMED181]
MKSPDAVFRCDSFGIPESPFLLSSPGLTCFEPPKVKEELSMRIQQFCSVWLCTLLCLLSPNLFGQEGEKTAVKPFELTAEEQSQILDLFNASSEKVSPAGVLEVSYDFTKDDESLGDDWMPVPSSVFGKVGQSVRWSRAGEASRVGFGNAIYFADKGQWFHQAVFEPDVRLEMEARSLVGGQRKDFFCAVFAWGKKLSRRVGSNLGSQLMRISGIKSAGAVGPAPGIIFQEPKKFGYEIKDGTYQVLSSGRSVTETKSSKFLKSLASGQVGCVWSGKISMCVGSISIRGKLDLDWVGRKIPSVKERLEEYRKTAGSKKS